jgi:hypothetical protein
MHDTPTELTTSPVVVSPTQCDGGKLPCDAQAVYAYRVRGERVWEYACGRHLTWGLTKASGGEQAAYDVRRILTEE